MINWLTSQRAYHIYCVIIILFHETTSVTVLRYSGRLKWLLQIAIAVPRQCQQELICKISDRVLKCNREIQAKFCCYGQFAAKKLDALPQKSQRMLSLTAHWHKTLSSDTQHPLWSAKIMAAKNETVLFELEAAFHKNGSINFIFKRKLFFLWLMVWLTKYVFQLVFREVLQVLQDWFAALTKRIKRVTRKQEEGFSMYF